MIRKNISLADCEYQIIYDFAKKNGYSFSEILRKATLDYIQKEEEIDLVKFLNARLDFVSEEEQQEIDALNIDFNNLNGEELSIDDFL